MPSSPSGGCRSNTAASLAQETSPLEPREAATAGRDLSPALAPTAGGDIPSSQSGRWWAHNSSKLAPKEAPAAAAPPSDWYCGIPFISSNPAVPLPTGETDTASLRPLPRSFLHL
ncbi:hypothetical protein AXF42_Ash018807 [Apostasia shenzhenica]|uniref:Uncharacterized protein n=1 Tax=Apostasia shenzhenica TaxID=1088818 RepID=A0A2I0B145_9ASPA|nr:hypothetical protein AXF42_Ash018807 [Apostasia shenzhenica]